MTRYSQALQLELAARMLPPYSVSPETLALETGISVDTLNKWKAAALGRCCSRDESCRVKADAAALEKKYYESEKARKALEKKLRKQETALLQAERQLKVKRQAPVIWGLSEEE